MTLLEVSKAMMERIVLGSEIGVFIIMVVAVVVLKVLTKKLLEELNSKKKNDEKNLLNDLISNGRKH